MNTQNKTPAHLRKLRYPSLFVVLLSYLLFPKLLWAQEITMPLTLQESTTETDFTTSMAWGDYDNDGDLDLMVGNGMLIADDIPFGDEATDAAFRQFPDLRDFFVKEERHNVLYCNENGSLVRCWTSDENDFTTNVAWGDYDNDGDLDLAVSNAGLGLRVRIFPSPWPAFQIATGGASNRVYRNNLNCPGRPKFEAVWQSSDAESSMNIAWADYNGDGQLDLAVANSAHYMLLSRSPAYENGPWANRLYKNTTTATDPCADPTFERDVAFPELAEISFGVAWVDVDDDSDWDLAVANGRTIRDGEIVDDENGDEQGLERVYCNQYAQSGNAEFVPCWQSSDPDFSISMSWGDMDGNGYPDLVVGNGRLWEGEPNVLYSNSGLDVAGTLQMTRTWRSDEVEPTVSVALGDADGDGDLDLAVGNGNFDGNAPNQVYCNTGRALTTEACWTSEEEDITLSVAWGDVDGDGALDLAAGNFSVPIGQQNRLYHSSVARFPRSFAGWQAPQGNSAYAVAWGDMDGDGDLDLALGIRGRNELYCNQAGSLTLVSTFNPPVDDTNTLAWGDVDGDHDLDLIVGNRQRPTGSTNDSFYLNRLYRNDHERNDQGRNDQGQSECQPQFTEVWTFGVTDDTRTLAWGDMDGDGDLDLAVGNGYRNALDLPAGQLNYIYRNDSLNLHDGDPTNDTLQFTRVWTSTESESTRAVAWGDVDQDGDLDLAAGNSASPSRLYRNDGFLNAQQAIFTKAWETSELADTHSLAWGDMNEDGFIDLAIGNTTQSTRVFCNEDGMLATRDCWRSIAAERTRSIAWGDMDGDGDLDLAVGNQEGPNHIYLNNNGLLTPRAIWTSDDTAINRDGANSSYTLAVAWGDLEGDGDLDLAVANADEQPSGIYLNVGRVFKAPDNVAAAAVILQQRCTTPTKPFCHRRATAPFAVVFRPGETPSADHFSSAEIITATNAVSVPYRLFAVDNGTAINIFPEYSLDGGGHWLPATPAEDGSGNLTNLHGSTWPTGTNQSFLWNAAADVTRSDNVVFRIRTQSAQMHSPIHWPALGSQSPPFRMVADWYVRVQDWRGQPVANAALYADGTFITVTNRAGLVGPQVLTPTTDLALIALSPQHRQNTPRGAHPDNAVYTINQTTLHNRTTGENLPTFSSARGEQSLTTAITMPLVLYDLVVSIEWPATITYTQSISAAMHNASDYLFDLTDGQMALRHVTIYDAAQHWSDADIQISAQNTVRPHATIGGITSTVASHAIRIGRAWDGRSANQGAWHLRDGYRTIVHEFGHYAFSLYDEYFRYHVDDMGNFTGRDENTLCISDQNREEATDATNASAMDWQYSSSELSDKGLEGTLWEEICKSTAQWQITERDVGRGESAWDTIVRRLADREPNIRWQILRPSDRGMLLAGPATLPVGLPDWPHIEIKQARDQQLVNPDSGVTVVVARDNIGIPYIGVTLAKANGATIEQGRTITGGHIAILGAAVGDVVRAASNDGAWAGSLVVSEMPTLTMILEPIGDRRIATPAEPPGAMAPAAVAPAERLLAGAPYMRITPTSVANDAEPSTLSFTVHNFDPPVGSQAGLTVIIHEPGTERSRYTQAGYSATQQNYRGEVSFTPQREDTNQVQVIGAVDGEIFFLQSTYRLQRVEGTAREAIYSSDGKLILELNPDSITDERSYFVINTQNTTIGTPAPGLTMLSAVYDITASGHIPALALPGSLTIAYDATRLPHDDPNAELGIYRWDAATSQWSRIEGAIFNDEVRGMVSISVQQLGAYAVFMETIP